MPTNDAKSDLLPDVKGSFVTEKAQNFACLNRAAIRERLTRVHLNQHARLSSTLSNKADNKPDAHNWKLETWPWQFDGQRNFVVNHLKVGHLDNVFGAHGEECHSLDHISAHCRTSDGHDGGNLAQNFERDGSRTMNFIRRMNTGDDAGHKFIGDPQVPSRLVIK